MIDKLRLSLILGKFKEHSNPNYFLQQYMIKPAVAADILFMIKKDIENNKVFDLGCGTGRLSIGSALLGAKSVVGYDIDKNVIEIAKENLKISEIETGIPLSKICKFKWMDVMEIEEKCDVVIQFPPIIRDIEFLKKAIEIGNKVFSIHIDYPSRIEEIKKRFKIKILSRIKYPISFGNKNNIVSGLVLIKYDS